VTLDNVIDLLSSQYRAHQSQIAKRLRGLFDKRYIGKARFDIRYVAKENGFVNHPDVYYIKQKGFDVISPLLTPHDNFHEKVKKAPNIEHDLAVTKIVAKFTRDADKHDNIEFISQPVLLPLFKKPHKDAHAQWHVRCRYKGNPVKLGVLPDWVFRVKIGDKRADYFLEFGRRMALEKSALNQNSIYKKNVAYFNTYQQGLQKEECSMEHFRVLFIEDTSNKQEHGKNRIDRMIDLVQRPEFEGKGRMFNYAFLEDILNTEDIYTFPFLTGKGDTTQFVR
jgi:hypothetical protein